MQGETRKILESVQNGSISVDEALVRLKTQPFDDLGYAKVDIHREIRQGVPEVIYGAGKTPEHIVGIMGAMLKNGQKQILITRLSKEAADAVSKTYSLTYRENARLGYYGSIPDPDGIETVVVATASVIGGLADCPVIAVQTCVGYGAAFGGLSALLSMLNSCASGVSVVNIDNGFGAGYLANIINHVEAKK